MSSFRTPFLTWTVYHKDPMVDIVLGMLLAHLLIIMKNLMIIFLKPHVNQCVEANSCSTFLKNTQIDLRIPPTLVMPPGFFHLPPNVETL